MNQSLDSTICLPFLASLQTADPVIMQEWIFWFGGWLSFNKFYLYYIFLKTVKHQSELIYPWIIIHVIQTERQRVRHTGTERWDRFTRDITYRGYSSVFKVFIERYSQKLSIQQKIKLNASVHRIITSCT